MCTCPSAEEKRHVAEISCCAGGTHVLQNRNVAFLSSAPGHQHTSTFDKVCECIIYKSGSHQVT